MLEQGHFEVELFQLIAMLFFILLFHVICVFFLVRIYFLLRRLERNKQMTGSGVESCGIASD